MKVYVCIFALLINTSTPQLIKCLQNTHQTVYAFRWNVKLVQDANKARISSEQKQGIKETLQKRSFLLTEEFVGTCEEYFTEHEFMLTMMRRSPEHYDVGCSASSKGAIFCVYSEFSLT